MLELLSQKYTKHHVSVFIYIKWVIIEFGVIHFNNLQKVLPGSTEITKTGKPEVRKKGLSLFKMLRAYLQKTLNPYVKKLKKSQQ